MRFRTAPARNTCIFLLSLAATLGLVRAQSVPEIPTAAVSFAKVTGVTPLANGIEVRDGLLIMRITALRDDVVRIRASRTGVLPEDASWAVLPEARSAKVAVTQDSDA